MIKLSAAIIVRNEEANLPRWLAAVRPVAEEIVAVDSGSTDRTVEILEQAGARVARREWTGYADQRNYLADLCTGDWILMLDADEVLGPQSTESLLRFKAAPPAGCVAFALPSRVWYFGRWLRFGGFFPEWKVRLYKKGAARWVSDEVHERLQTAGARGR
jgi:glycosyltransferase involved in cell wall biosynthesis